MKLDWKPYLWYLGSIKRSFDGVVKGGEDPSFEWWRRREPLGLSNCTFLTGRTFSFGAEKELNNRLFNSNPTYQIKVFWFKTETWIQFWILTKIKFCESAENVLPGVQLEYMHTQERFQTLCFYHCITVIYWYVYFRTCWCTGVYSFSQLESCKNNPNLLDLQ